LSIKVSIITVCFNSAKTIEQTIKSVLSQTYNNIEYIIIDGCSTDGTLDIIKKYKDDISYWVSEPDNGIYDAMNKGLAKATGDVIGIINSDDWYDAETVANVVETFLTSDCDFVHGDIIRVYEDTNLQVRCKPSSISKRWHKTAFYHPTWFIRKKIYEEYGFFRTEFLICGDYELLLRLYKNNVKMCYVENNLAYYRMDGFSNKQTFIGYQEIRKISVEYGYSKAKAFLWYYYRVNIRKIYNVVSKSRLLLNAYFYLQKKNS